MIDFGLAQIVPGIKGPIGSVTDYKPDVVSKRMAPLPVSSVRRSSRLSSPPFSECKQSVYSSSVQGTRSLWPTLTPVTSRHNAHTQLKTTRSRPTARESAISAGTLHSSVTSDSKCTYEKMDSKRTSRESTLSIPFILGYSNVDVRLCPTRHKVNEVCDTCCSKPSQNTPRAGTPGFRAPEVLMKSPEQSTAVDIWAAGVTMLCILSARYPFFKAQNDMEALAQIVTLFGSHRCVEAAHAMGKDLVCSPDVPGCDLKELCNVLRYGRDSTASCMCGKETQGKERQECWVCLSDSAYDLLKCCLDLNPFTRITADQALSHPFLADAYM